MYFTSATLQVMCFNVLKNNALAHCCKQHTHNLSWGYFLDWKYITHKTVEEVRNAKTFTKWQGDLRKQIVAKGEFTRCKIYTEWISSYPFHLVQRSWTFGGTVTRLNWQIILLLQQEEERKEQPSEKRNFSACKHTKVSTYCRYCDISDVEVRIPRPPWRGVWVWDYKIPWQIALSFFSDYSVLCEHDLLLLSDQGWVCHSCLLGWTHRSGLSLLPCP